MVKLKELRIKKGATLATLSKLLGYKYPGGYHKIEQGKQQLTVEQAKKLADYYEMDVSIFLNKIYSS